MDEGILYVVLLVFVLLRPLVGTSVVLSNPHLQPSHTHHVVQIVGGCQHLGRPSRVVVIEVLRDDGTAADKVVVCVEDEAGPGELSRTGLSVAQS